MKNDNRVSFDKIWIDLALSLKQRSTCSRLQVGCVVVSEDNSYVLAIGYNGGAKGLFNNCLSSEPGKCQHVHAEVNALVKLNTRDSSKKKLYVTTSPCFTCSTLIINAGISEVIYLDEYRSKEGLELIQEAGIRTKKISEADLCLKEVRSEGAGRVVIRTSEDEILGRAGRC